LSSNTVEFPRKSRPRKYAVEFRNRLRSRQQRPTDHLQFLRQLAQDSQDLCGFIFGKLDQLIVRLNGFERLHENRLPRRARSVHDAQNCSAMFGANGNHEAVVPQRHVVLSRFRVPRAQNLLQILLDGIARLRDARSDAP